MILLRNQSRWIYIHSVLSICLLFITLPVIGQISSFPYSEDFESDFGSWTNATGDDLDWTRTNTTTPSSDTGPSAAASGSYYLFIEASTFGTGFPEKRAYLEATFDFTGEFDPKLTFDYHMYGGSMGTLFVDVYDGAWTTGVFSLTGEQQTAGTDAWRQAVVDLTDYENRSNITVRLRGVTGSDYQGDISIDNFSVCTIDPGTATISDNVLCSAGTVDLSLSGQDGGGTIQWQQSTDNLIFTDIGGGTSADYTTGTLSTGNNYYFRAEVTNSCANYSNTVSVVVESASGTINTFPYSEGFEGGFGSWANAAGDDFDWSSNSGTTSSADTGPTSANGGSNYLYTEASDPNNPNKSALVEASFDFSGITDPELTFYYHMYGDEMGALYIDVGADQNVFSLVGSQQTSSSDDWEQATVDLSEYGGRCNVTIGFRGVTSVDFSSDISIDDIVVRDACKSVNGGTASISDDVLCSAGTVDLSLIGQDGGATLQWQQSTDNISFSDIGGATSPNYTTSTLSTGSTYYFRAAATVGCTNYSDTVSVIVGTGGGSSTFPYSEGFESDFGIWSNPSSGDDFDWSRTNTTTPSADTGPSAANGGSYYIFTEATGNNPGLDAFLEADFDFTGISTPILTFNYHMFGETMGTLYLYANGTEIWSVSGEQQAADTDSWITETVDLSDYANECNVTLRFRGRTGTDFTSDISIDDIAICTVDPGSATISSNALCSAGSVDLALNSYDAGTTIQWQQSTDNITFSDIGGATADLHTTSSLSTGSTYYFRAAVTNGCTNYSNTVSVNVTSGGVGVSSFPYSEDFEAGLGVWSNPSSGDDFDWTQNTGTTPSESTGPSGGNSGFAYVYTEATDPNNPNKSAFLEADFDFTALTSPKLTFFYHMYGVGMGSLYVDVNGTNVFSISGPQQSSTGDAWTQEVLDLSDFAGECNAQIRFRGVTGNFRSDMAVDDVSVCSAPSTSAISGNADVCKSATGEAYSVTNNSGNTYTWLIDGGVQASGGTTNSITVDWGATGKVGSVKVLERSGECVGDTVTLSVNIHTIETSEISGNTIVPENETGVSYSVTNTSGYSYAWSISGGSQASGGTTNSITVDWGAAGAGDVSVIATSTSPSCAAAPSVNSTISIYSIITSNGAGGGDWNNTGTWSCACIPLTTESVQILNGDVVTLTQAETIDNLVIDVGGTVNNSTFTLTVTGDYTINGTHSGTGIIDLTGAGTSIDGTGTISTSGDLRISSGDKTILSTANFSKTSGDLNISSSNIDVTNNGSISIAGNLVAVDGTDTWMNGSGSSLDVEGTLLSSGSLNASATGNTITYGVSGAQSVKLPNGSQYYNLVLTSTGAKSLTGNTIIQNDITISGTAQLDLTTSNYDLAVRGDWTNSSADGDPFVERNGAITFDGSSGDQTIVNTNGETFYDLVVNKTNGDLILGGSSDIVISNSLTLTQGLISPTTSETVTFNDNATATSTSSSYVNGKVIKIGDDAFTFPVGKTNRGQIGISAPGVGSTFEAEYFDAGYTADQSTVGLSYISGAEYWVLDRTTGSDAVSVTLYWDSGTLSGIEDIAGSDLRVAHYNGSDWIDEGGTYTGTISSGSVTSSGTISTFSPFTFASAAADNPLPVELLSFEGYVLDNSIELKWITASELNNDFFEIQRSIDGISFDVIGFHKGNGTRTGKSEYKFLDKSPIPGVSYYRLKQVDYDGMFEILPTIYVNNESPLQRIQSTLFPNPAVDSNLTIRTISQDVNSSINIDIFDNHGRRVATFVKEPEMGITDYSIPLTQFGAGIYQVIVRQNGDVQRLKMIVK